MNYNVFFKLFTLFFVLVLFPLQSFSSNFEENVLSKIVVDKAENNSFRLGLFFNEKFTGNAFIQKNRKGVYSIYIPNTIINKKNAKIVYKNKKDKDNLQIEIDEKPFIKDDHQSSYVKLSVDIAENYSLKLVSKTMEEDKNTASFISLNLFSLILIVIAAVIVFLMAKIISASEKYSKNSRCYTSYPAGYLNFSLKDKNEETLNTDEQPLIRQSVLPKVNIRKALKSSDSDSFSCFDIPLADDSMQAPFKFKSTLKQTSDIQKEKTAKSKLTNPIIKTTQDDSSELALPIVEDIEVPVVNKKEEKTAPELLSELNITPTKGFYLTTSDDTFALFGFVKDKVFLLKKFADLSQINLQARFYDRRKDNDLYIVRLDSYKALVEISDNEINELAVL